MANEAARIFQDELDRLWDARTKAREAGQQYRSFNIAIRYTDKLARSVHELRHEKGWCACELL